MLATVYQNEWMTAVTQEAIRTDSTRMAQGIMTGIGFLGAGVIFKEGLTVRGLTTAASIWVTAAIGILVGVGFYLPAILGAVVTLAVLAVFRIIEQRLPSEIYAHHILRFDRGAVKAEDDLRKLIGEHGFTVANLSYRLTESGKVLNTEWSSAPETREIWSLWRNIFGLCQRLSSSELLRPEINPANTDGYATVRGYPQGFHTSRLDSRGSR